MSEPARAILIWYNGRRDELYIGRPARQVRVAVRNFMSGSGFRGEALTIDNATLPLRKEAVFELTDSPGPSGALIYRQSAGPDPYGEDSV